MPATKAVPLQIAPKIASDSSENAYNLEVSDESSCNSDVDILDLICETTRVPENSFCDKDILRSDECKESYRAVPPTLHSRSLDVSDYNSSTDSKSEVMTRTATFDVCNLNQFNTNSNENSSIDDLLSALTLKEHQTFIKSGKDSIDSTLFDFLEEIEQKCELIEDDHNELNIGSRQKTSPDSKCEKVSSLSLAALAECHFRENHLGDSVPGSTHVQHSEVTSNSYFISFEDSKRDLREPVPCNADFGISLSALAESYLASETESNRISSQTTSKKNNSKEVDDLDILSFIDSINTEAECISSANCSGEILDFSAKENESSVFSELLEDDEDVDEGYDSGKLSPGIDLNECIKNPTTSAQYFKKSIPSDDHSVLLPQDEGISQGFVDVLINNREGKNALNLIPKPSVFNTKQSLFAKVLTCKSDNQNETAGKRVSNIRKALFEKYFCATEKNILCNVQDSKKLVDKSRESIIAAGYFHFPSLPHKKC